MNDLINKYIHIGNKGLQQTNSIESYHRNINLRYRLDLINLKFRKLYRHIYLWCIFCSYVVYG